MKGDFNGEIEEQKIAIETVLPSVPEIHIDEHRGEYLVLNPLGPWWFVGSRLHADFARLCDGKRSLKDIRESLSSYHEGLTDEYIIRVAESLLKASFFKKTVKQKIRLLSVVFFNITKRCNLNCPYCYYDSIPVKCEENEEELDSTVWIKLAGEIAEINPRAKVMISGGEPLIRPDIIEIIEGVSQNNLEVKLVTNATLFTEDIISKLSKIDKFSVQVSIDSIIPEVNAKSRGKGNLEKALTAVHRLKDAGIDVEISSTITRLNNKSIRQFREYCDKNHLKFRSSIFMISGEKSKRNAEWLELNPGEYLDASTYALEYYDPNTTMGHPMVPGERRHSCGLGYGQVDISPGGSLFPCSHLNDSKFCIGNIQTSELRQLAADGYKRYSPFDIDMINQCSSTKCPVRYFCAGGCKAITLHQFGTMNVPAKNCDQLKQIYISALWVSVNGPSFLKERIKGKVNP
jgi:radical SAM protein with 4Fe4S-binding SPASM domain